MGLSVSDQRVVSSRQPECDVQLTKLSLLRLQGRVVGAREFLERWRGSARLDQVPMIDKVLGLLEADEPKGDGEL
jgi:hypothetical protein